MDISKIIEVGFLSYTPTASTLNLDEIILGDATQVGISRTTFQSMLQVYPNPASEEFIIDADIKSLSIFNSIGQIVYSSENYLKGSSVNIREFQEGLYVIIADDIAHKLVVK